MAILVVKVKQTGIASIPWHPPSHPFPTQSTVTVLSKWLPHPNMGGNESLPETEATYGPAVYGQGGQLTG